MFPTNNETFFLWNCIWQTTLCLTIGGLASAIWAHWPARAHRILALTIIASLAVPIFSQVVHQFDWGVFMISPPELLPYREDEKRIGISDRSLPAAQPNQSTLAEKRTEDAPIPNSPAQTPKKSLTASNAVDFQPSHFNSWENSFLLAWGILSITILIRLMGSLAFEWIVLCSAQSQEDKNLQIAVEEAADKLGLKVAPIIFLSSRVRCPVICCWGRRPTLIFPISLAASIASRECADLLCHELAHWKRRDHLFKLLGELAIVLFPWQPLLWWANKRLNQLSERACDDWVLACGHAPVSYAESLLRLIPQKKSALVLPAVSHRKKLQNRIHNILEGKQNNPLAGWVWGSIVSLASVCVIVTIAFAQTKTMINAETVSEATGVKKTSSLSEMTLRLVDKSDNSNPTFTAMSPVSQDGKYIVYSSNQNFKIHEIATGMNRTIPNLSCNEGEIIYSPIISPDNAILYYCKWSNKKKSFELHVIGLDGSGDRIFFERQSNDDNDDFFITGLTPDNQKALAVWDNSENDQEKQIMLVSVNDGSVQVVKNFTQQSPNTVYFSPDGKFITFNLPKAINTYDSDIFLIAADGSQEIPLFQSQADEKLLGWSPDGKWILFTTNSYMGIMGIDAYIQSMENGKLKGKPFLVKKDIGNLLPIGFTRDGSFYYRIRYTTGGLYQARFDFKNGKNLSSLTPIFMGIISNHISWSPDGKYGAFYEFNYALGAGGGKPLCILSEETGQVQKFVIAPSDLNYIHWSPDSKSILSESMWEKGLYKVNVQTGKAEILIKNASDYSVHHAQYLPDGKNIVFCADNTNTETDNCTDAWFAIRNLETGNEKKILSDPNLTSSYAVSLDGKWLAFAVNDPKNEETNVLKLISLSGGDAKVILDKFPSPSYRQINLAWTTDSSSLLYLEDNDLMQISITGGNPRKLYHFDFHVGPINVHPDGQRIAFFSGGYKDELLVMENFLPKSDASVNKSFQEEHDAFMKVSQDQSLNPSLTITNQLITDNFEDANMEGWVMSEDSKKDPPFTHKVENGELNLENSRACIGLIDWKNYRIKVRYCPNSVGDSDGGGNGVVFFRRTATSSSGFHCFPKVNMVQMVAGHKEPTGESKINVLKTTKNINFEINKWYNLEMEIISNHFKGYVDGQLVFDVTDDQSPNGSIALKANGLAHFDDFRVELLPE